jgi:predicted alpha/beta-hydrolase family hydrolase
LEIDTPRGLAWADLDRPRAARGLLVIGHGAGGSVEAPDIVTTRDAALDRGLAVARITQPYRVAGRRAPSPAPQLDEAWLAALARVRRQRSLASVPLVVAGRSSGARVACRTANDVGALGVIALAFPLHPPGKPEQTRLPELETPRVPILVIQGSRDPFGVPESAPGRDVVLIEGADHGLKRSLATVREAVAGFVTALVQ